MNRLYVASTGKVYFDHIHYIGTVRKFGQKWRWHTPKKAATGLEFTRQAALAELVLKSGRIPPAGPSHGPAV